MQPQLKSIIFLLMTIAIPALQGQPQGYNYDEEKVPQYELPDPLTSLDGQPVRSVEEWQTKRRPEILGLFEIHEYGTSPAPPENLRFKVIGEDKKALSGLATRKEVRIYFSKDDSVAMDVLIYLPNQTQKPAPAFLTLNFYGNHTIHSDPGITLPTSWMRNNDNFGIENNRATDASRGVRSSRWAVETILKRGYALATVYYGDIDPDFDDGFQNGIHPLFYKQGQTQPKPHEWGSIAAWAWGLSRVMDYFEKDSDIDEKQVAVMGHSRLGKTSLWAGAADPRFALVISNDSGCGGAALSRRRFGETVQRINTSFPHWFCDNFNQYNDNEDELPMDQHMLIALMAPRPVYVASAQEDLWADPKGEFLSAKHAGPVYALFGKQGVGVSEMPPVNHPVGGFVGYHMRTGKHDVTDYDWEQYLNFADRHFK